MTDIAPTETTEAPAPKPHRRPNKRPKRAAKPAVEKPEEFAGLNATECCNACRGHLIAAQQAQRRLNELEMMYPRQPAPPLIHPVTGWRMAPPSVMETDEQYLARNPQIADEFRKLGEAVLGKCDISGLPGCAHPNKSGLNYTAQRDSRAIARYERAKEYLDHQKVDRRRR